MEQPRNPFDESVIIVLVLAVPVLAWWVFHGTLVSGLFHLKLVELRLVVAAGFGSAETVELALALREALAVPDKLPLATFVFALDAVGQYLRLPVGLALLGLGGWLIGGHPAERFCQHYDLAGLAEAIGGQWPFALHALRRGQLRIPLDDPRWGLAQSALEYAERQHLWVVPNPTAGAETEPTVPTLHRERTLEALARQLGAPWTTVEHAPLPVQALAGLFALRATSCTITSDAEAERLKQRSWTLLRDLALAAANHAQGEYLPPAAAYQRVARATAPFLQADAMRAIIAQHAYTQTVLVRLLAEARQGGVLPSALFSWLKGVDRPLWYALTSLGRRVPFVEALGTIAHYQAERAAGGALPQPTVEAAGAALRAAVEAPTTAVRPTPTP